MDVEQVDFINVPTRDATRAFAWYHEVLGLPLDPNNSEELRAGQVTVTFWEPEGEGFEFKPDVGGFAVRVPDVDEAKAELEAKGVECVGSGDTGVCNMAVVLDPDGNAVILHRR
ncbi:MAG TPA: VOC family protein, partial [Gaiellaceae bacterium]|nr:VOC family protein [Gaiellaceae bacterium]